jgi:TolB protein
MDRSAPDRSSFERFDRLQQRRQRDERIGVILVASALAIIAVLFVARAIPRAERPAVPPPHNGRIVFVRFDPRSNEPVAFSMDPDGSNMTQMFFSGFFSGHSEWPHWSPDGTQVAIFCCDDRRSPQIVDVDSGRLREFAWARPHLAQYCGFAWSPDGRFLACGAFGKIDPRLTGIWTIRSSDGGGLRQVTSNPGGEDNVGDFSPDGKRLVFLRKDENGEATGIFVVNLDGSGLHRITPPGMILDWFGGSWLPTGNRILFVARTDPEHRRAIWEVNVDGGDLHQLPISPACGGPVADPKSTACSYPGWSPDGTKIVFTRITANGTTSDIAIVNADGSGLVQITHTGDAGEADWGTHPLARGATQPA